LNRIPEPEAESTEPASAVPPSQEDLLGRRIGAALIDLALLVALFAILAATIGESTVGGGGFSFELPGAEGVMYYALVLLYYFALEAAFGQTVGKLLLGLRVVRTDGGRPSVAAIAIRTLVRVVDWLPFLYLVGFIAMQVTGERRQRLGDLAAGTGVARALPVRHRSLAAAAVALVVLVLLGLSFYQATGDDDVSGPKNEPTATPETLAVREGEVLFQDDFSDPTSGWGTAVYEEGEAGYVEGAYRIFVKQAEVQVFSDFDVSRVQGLRLEFEATQLAGTSGDLAGARCFTDIGSDAGYILGIAPAEQGYRVAAFRGDDYRLLESSGERVDAILPQGEENELRVECVASPDAPIVLTLGVNGEALVRAEDEEATRGFDGFGIIVDTTEGGAEAHFDDFVMTELLPK
jgi:uncharacterized RDD family membrane protein YckC